MKTLCSVLLFYIFVNVCAQSPIYPVGYDVLGPFPKGMREIGADTLEAFGSIFNIPRGGNLTYPSEYAPNGQTTWMYVESEESGLVHIKYGFWEDSFLQAPYGWSTLLWKGWALGDIQIPEDGSYLLQCFNTKTVYIDSREYQTDWFSYNYYYNLVNLTAGTHTLFVQVESSMRAFGNTPNISFQCQVTKSEEILTVPVSSVSSPGSIPFIIPSVVNKYPKIFTTTF